MNDMDLEGVNARPRGMMMMSMICHPSIKEDDIDFREKGEVAKEKDLKDQESNDGCSRKDSEYSTCSCRPRALKSYNISFLSIIEI
jgi:hypothetical protein